MFRIAWKYIKGYKKNTVTCMLGIVFSVMLIFSLVGISSRIMDQFQHMLIDGTPLHDFKIHNLDHETVDEIYNDILPDDCFKLINQWCGTIYTDKTFVNISLIAVEGQWEEFYKTEVKEGKRPENPYEICVEERFCKEYGVKLSDELIYDLYDDEGNLYNVKFKVVGIINNIASSSRSEYIFTSYETSKNLIKNQGFVVDKRSNSILVALNLYECNIDKNLDLTELLMKKYTNNFYIENIEWNDEKENLFLEKDFYVSFSKSFYGICGVVFICMTIFIYNAISISMTEKIRQYGMLRCIGVSSRKLVLIMLIEQFFNVIFGLVLGITGGKLLNYVIADKLIGCFLSVENYELTESIWTYIITFAVVIIAVMLVFIAIYKRISKYNPLEMLRYMETTKEIKVTSRTKNIIWDMANRNIKRNPLKSRILLSTVCIATLLIILIGNTITSIDLEIYKTPSGIADVEVMSFLGSEEAPYIKRELIEHLNDETWVEEVYYQKMAMGYALLVDGNVNDELEVILVYSDNLMQKFLEFNDVKGLDMTDDIAIMLIEKGESNKSEISIRAEEENVDFSGSSKKYTVPISESVLISNSTLIGTQFPKIPCVIINESLAKKIMGDIEGYDNIYVKLKEYDADISDVKEMIGIDEYTYIDLNEGESEIKNQLLGMIIMALYMLISVILLNVFVISNIIKSNISLRTREIGMLRSIGASKKWIEKSIIGEIIILALEGMIIALLLSIPFSCYIYYIINESVGIGYLGYVIGPPVIIIGVYIICKIVLNDSLTLKIIENIRNE